MSTSDAAREWDAALRKSRLLMLALGLVVLANALLGSLMVWADVEHALDGEQATLWILRGALAFASVVSLAVARQLRRSAEADSERPLSERLQSSTVVSGALAEAISVYGLLLTVLGGEIVDCLAFGAVAMAALASFLPNRDEWERRARVESFE